MKNLKRVLWRLKNRVVVAVIFFLTVIPFWFSPLYGSNLDDTEVMDLFSQGKAFFRKANELSVGDPEEAVRLYEKSLIRFEKIVREGGIQNGQLYYNIGNAYFRMKDIGRAILNYRRAQQYIPNDPNLQQNLTNARARRVDKIEERQKTIVLRTLFFWHYDLSIRTRLFIFGGSYVFLWVFLASRFLVRRSIMNWGFAVAVISVVLFGGSLFVDSVVLRKIRPGVIVSGSVIARKGNSGTYESSFKDPLHAGTEFILVEGRGAWYHIELADARRCWVPGVDVDLVR